MKVFLPGNKPVHSMAATPASITRIRMENIPAGFAIISTARHAYIPKPASVTHVSPKESLLSSSSW
ncbi:MAG TPA: hypothetical protein PK024_00580 [Methanospirillum sp.]|uniref:hypothetical protein n=1 Tax=Methanospirillum sp. TaxID=45200 RepID=UPI002C962F5C|nr:hypothetical protein [Methanospirillum sp.]HOJ95324.1 hypothetical protein [Methanospirillum sp.]HPP78386.1 hypothetical protein [Methanospirillum sp.]